MGCNFEFCPFFDNFDWNTLKIGLGPFVNSDTQKNFRFPLETQHFSKFTKGLGVSQMLTMDFNISTDHQASKTSRVLICIEKYACPCYHIGLGLGHIRPHSLATNLTVICYNHPVSPIAWQCARVQQVTKIEMSRCKERLVSMPSPTADMLISRLCNLNFWVKLYIKKFKNLLMVVLSSLIHVFFRKYTINAGDEVSKQKYFI